MGKKVEILCVVLFLVFLIFVFSEAVLFVSFFWSSFHSSFSPTLGIWPVEGLYLPDPLELAFANTLLLSNGALFFFLTGLHFFHVVVGLILISLVLWSSCFSYKVKYWIRVQAGYLFYHQQLIYWHFVEVLWL